MASGIFGKFRRLSNMRQKRFEKKQYFIINSTFILFTYCWKPVYLYSIKLLYALFIITNFKEIGNG